MNNGEGEKSEAVPLKGAPRPNLYREALPLLGEVDRL